MIFQNLEIRTSEAVQMNGPCECISDVFRLAREELEDRYLRIMEENVVIKKHAGKQASQMKTLIDRVTC